MSLRTVASASLLALLVTLPTAAGALGQAAQPGPKPETAGSPVKLSLSADPRRDGRGRPVPGQLVLSATLTTPDGKPLNGRAVNFYQQVELMGTHDAFIGTATTDATGLAALLYEPAQSGPQQLKAMVQAADGFAAQETSASATIRDSVPPFKPEPLPLGSVATGLSLGSGLLVAGIWAVLLGVLVRTVVGLKTAAPAPDKRSNG